MKHKHFIGKLLLASSVLFSFSSCLDENDDEFKKQDDAQKQYEAENRKFDRVNNVTVSGEVNGYSFVDLGLPSGLKWATYNVGATKADEIGDYFAWGETTSKDTFSLDSYKWYENKEYTKYTTTTNKKYILDAVDDAATANWGKPWRMPTRDEQIELANGCIWRYFINFANTGVEGIVGISKYNDNVIFLPSTGEKPGWSDVLDYTVGGYWSSSLGSNGYSQAFHLHFSKSTIIYLSYGIDTYDFSRITGRCVRAVK